VIVGGHERAFSYHINVARAGDGRHALTRCGTRAMKPPMSLKKMVMERGMKLMSDPRVMKLMSNPKVMNVVMKGFQLRGKAQASIDERVSKLAKTLKLATREEVSSLKDTIRTLERALKEVQAEVKKGNGAPKA
jgi:hypothetical protein